MSAELTAYDYNIRRYQNAANVDRELALHFAESSEEKQRIANYWLAERAKYLGELGVDNVIPMPGIEGPGVA